MGCHLCNYRSGSLKHQTFNIKTYKLGNLHEQSIHKNDIVI